MYRGRFGTSHAAQANGYKRAREVASPAHLGALHTADSGHDSRQSKQPLLARLDILIESATAAFLDDLDDSEKPTAKLYIQKPAQAADESWQRTAQGQNGPTVMPPTISEVEQSGSASEDEDDDSELTFTSPRKNPSQRTTAPSAALPAVWQNPTEASEGHTSLEMNVAASDKDQGSVSHACLSQVALPLGRVCGQCPHDYTTCKRDSATKPTRALVNAVSVGHSWILRLSMVKPAAPLKPPEDNTLVLTQFWEK